MSKSGINNGARIIVALMILVAVSLGILLFLLGHNLPLPIVVTMATSQAVPEQSAQVSSYSVEEDTLIIRASGFVVDSFDAFLAPVRFCITTFSTVFKYTNFESVTIIWVPANSNTGQFEMTYSANKFKVLEQNQEWREMDSRQLFENADSYEMSSIVFEGAQQDSSMAGLPRRNK